MSTENDSTYIKVPKSVVQIGAIAILFVIIDLISELIGLFRNLKQGLTASLYAQ